LRKAQLALDDLVDPLTNLPKTKAQNGLASAQETYNNAVNSLNKAYADGFNDVSDAFLVFPDAVTQIHEILKHNYLDEMTVRAVYGTTAVDYRNAALDNYYKAKDLVDDAEDVYHETDSTAEQSVIESLITQTYNAGQATAEAVKSLSVLLDYIDSHTSIEPGGLAADETATATMTSDVNANTTALLAASNTIKTTTTALASATRGIQEGSENVTDVNDNSDEIERARLDVQDAQLDIQQTSIDIGKRTIKSPIDGIVTNIIPNVGETASPSAPSISVISTSQFEIEANLPEADLAKVKLGADADVTLDAYGPDVVFPATVSFINPAEDILDGVATYKIKLLFVAPDDRIKSGMTADITVKGERKDNVIAVPQRAVISKNGGKYVRVLERENVIEKQVETGLRGSDGNIEITDGLTEGETIIVFSDGE
jgi:HlyD family secretion protein